MIESHTPQQELESNNISIQNQPSHFGRQDDQQLDIPIFSDQNQKKRPLKKQSEQINLQNRKFSENVYNLHKKKKKFSENNINFKQDPIELQNKYQQTHEFHFFGVYNQLNLNKYTEMLYWQKKQQNQEKIRKNSNFPQLNNFQDQQFKQQQQSKYEEQHNQSYVSNFDQTSQSNLKEKIKDINSQQQQLQNNISQQELNSQDDNSYFGISKEVFGASGQIIGCILIGYLVQTIILHHVGKLNDSLATNTVGMCISIISCLGGYFLIGVNQGIGSYIGRAYGGNNYVLMNNYFRQGLVMALFILFCLFILFLNSKNLLILLGQNKEVSIQTQWFLVRIMPGIICQYLFDLLKNYCNAQNIYNAPVFIQIYAAILHTFTCEYLVQNYQIFGAVISYNLVYGFSFICILGYLLYYKLLPSFTLKNITTNFKHFALEIVSMASANQLDIMTFEFSSILIGTTKNMEQFAAHVSFLNLCSLLYSTPLGIGAAFNYIISNAIGKQDSQKVKRCYYLNLIFQVTNGLLNIVFCEIFMDQITAFYTSSSKIQDTMKSIIHIYYLGIISDFLVNSSISILKSVGKAKQTVVIFIIAYYIIGLPIQIYLGLIQKFGVFGFWAGFDLAVITGSVSILILSQTFHWEDQINNIYDQLEKQKNELADYSEFEDTEEL